MVATFNSTGTPAIFMHAADAIHGDLGMVQEGDVVMIISTLTGLVIQLAGVDPVKALLYTAVLYGLTAPVMIGVILHICNNKKIMEEYTNTPVFNIIGFLALLLMTAAAVLLSWFILF